MPDETYTTTTTGISDPRIAAILAQLNLPTINSAGVVPYGDMANQLNTFMAGQAKNQFVLNQPGYEANTAKFAGNITDQLAGKLSPDVINLLAQQGAERGIATGNPGGPGANASYMKALGLTSMGQQALGAQNLHQMNADTPVAQLFNPSSLFIPEKLGAMQLIAALLGQKKGAEDDITGLNGPGYGARSIDLPGGQLGGGLGRSGLGGAPSYGSTGGGLAGSRIISGGPATNFRNSTPFNQGVNTWGNQDNPNLNSWMNQQEVGGATGQPFDWASGMMTDVTRTGGAGDVGGWGGSYDPFAPYDFFNPPDTTNQYSGLYSSNPTPRSSMEYYGNIGMPNPIGDINSYSNFFSPADTGGGYGISDADWNDWFYGDLSSGINEGGYGISDADWEELFGG